MCARSPGAEQVEHGAVEVEVEGSREDVVRCEVVALVHQAEVVAEAGMGEGHALGPAGRAGREQDVRVVGRGDGQRGRQRGAGGLVVQVEHGHRSGPGPGCTVRQQQADARGLGHVCRPGRGEVRVQRHHGGARVQRGEHAHAGVDPAGAEDAHHPRLPRHRAVDRPRPGERAPMSPGVGDGLPPGLHRKTVRGQFEPPQKTRMQGVPHPRHSCPFEMN